MCFFIATKLSSAVEQRLHREPRNSRNLGSNKTKEKEQKTKK